MSYWPIVQLIFIKTKAMRSVLIFTLILTVHMNAQTKKPRELGIIIGVIPTGNNNTITDVPGVKVGQVTINKGDTVHTGVTAIIPHSGNIFQQKIPAGIYVGNGFGKLAGSTQVMELGNIETPIILTNTLNVSTAIDAVISYTLNQKENKEVRSVNAVVGETNDGFLNDIRGQHVQKADVLNAIQNAKTGKVDKGNVGAGTGTVCFGFKGGIGTASRKLPASVGGYTVGVIVQTNFGGVLEIAGVPVGKELGQYFMKNELSSANGSCMIVVATDAPLGSRNLDHLAKRAFMGLAKTGGIAANGIGDYVIAFSTDSSLRIPHESKENFQTVKLLRNDAISPLFLVAIEATEEAIINSLFAAKTVT
jgi:D-aminopeptidase